MQPLAIALNDHPYLGQAFAAEEKFNLLWVSVPSWSDNAEELGRWQDGSGVAMAQKQMEGYTSVYVGTAPVPAEILQAIAQGAQVRLWSTQPDIVYACADAVSITATTDGEREIHLPKPRRLWQSQSARQSSFHLQMREGETVVFIA